MTDNPGRQPARLGAILRAAIFWLGFFVCFFLSRMIVGMLGITRGQWPGSILMTLMLLLWTWVCLRFDRDSPVRVGALPVPGSISRALGGILIAFPLSALSLLSLMWLVPGVHFVRSSATPLSFLAAVILFVLLSAYEEIGFRGYPLRRLMPAFGMWRTFLIVAIVFAGYHLLMGWGLPQALIGTTAGSFLFSMAAVAARRGLAFPIGVHAGWNLATWSLNNGAGEGFWQITFAPDLAHRVQIVGMVSYLVCMLLGIVLLWFWNRRPGPVTQGPV
jgi:uncharacterized protein